MEADAVLCNLGIEIYYVSANLSLTNREVACKSISKRKRSKALRLSNASLTRRSRKEELRERGPLCDMVNCDFARLIQCGELTPAMHFLPIARE